STGIAGIPVVDNNWQYNTIISPTGSLVGQIAIYPPTGIGSSWNYNMAYNVVLSSNVHDIYGFTSSQSTSTFFVTVPLLDPNQTQSQGVTTPLDSNQTTLVGVPEDSIPVGGFVVPRVIAKGPLLTAPAGSQNITQQGLIRTFLWAEVDIYRCSPTQMQDPTCGPSNSDKSLMVTL